MTKQDTYEKITWKVKTKCVCMSPKSFFCQLHSYDLNNNLKISLAQCSKEQCMNGSQLLLNSS